MSAWVIIAIAMATLGLRAGLVLGKPSRWETRIQPYLERVPSAVLPAIAVSALVPQVAGPDGSLRMVAAILAAGVAYKTRSILLTMVSGMLALYAFGALAG